MPHKDKIVRRAYMRQYKEKNREAILARRNELFAQAQRTKGIPRKSWTAGHSDCGICLSCGGKATCKPLVGCGESRHENSFERRKAKSNRYRAKRREEFKKTGRIYKNTSPQAHSRKLLHERTNRLNKQLALYSKFGGKCEVCGFADHRTLQLHHVNGGGHIHRKQLGWQYKKNVQQMSEQDLRETFQLICANCHAIITHTQRQSGSTSIKKNKGI